MDPDDVEPFSLDQMARQYRHGGMTAALGRPASLTRGPLRGRVDRGQRGPLPPGGRSARALAALARVDGWTAQSSTPTPPRCARRSPSGLLPGGQRDLGVPAGEGRRTARLAGHRGPALVPLRRRRPGQADDARTYLPRAQRAGARCGRNSGARTPRARRTRRRGAHTSAGLVTAERAWVCAGAIGLRHCCSAAASPRRRRTLRCHPTVKAAARFESRCTPRGTCPSIRSSPRGRRLVRRVGEPPGLVALALADDWAANRPAADDWASTGVYYAAIRPEGRGRVRVLPACATRSSPMR